MPVSFESFRREHSRLHDPEVVQSSRELVPVVPAGPAAAGDEQESPRRKKGRRRAARRDGGQIALPDVGVRGEVEVAPGVHASPPVMEFEALVFDDRGFEFRAPACRRAEMLWAREGAVGGGGAGQEVRRAVMDYERGGLFTATVGMEDGDYLLAFSADGCVRPNPLHSTRVVVRPDGPFSPARLARNLHALKIENRGSADEWVSLEADAPWVVPSAARVEPGGSAEVEFRLLPGRMPLGRSEATLRCASREGRGLDVPEGDVQDGDGPGGGAQDGGVTYRGVRVVVTAIAGGAVPVFHVSPAELGAIAQGRGHAEIEVRVGARGAGPLTGMVMLSNLDEVVDFRLDASEPKTYFAHTFRVDSSRLPYREEGALRLTLVTDSYLANYRQQRVDIPYSLIYLKKSLHALSYGRVKKGMTRTLRLEVSRSDGEEVDLEVSVPARADNCLEAFRVRPNVYSFRFDTRGVEAGGSVSESVTLTDRLSGLSDRVKVLAEVGG